MNNQAIIDEATAQLKQYRLECVDKDIRIKELGTALEKIKNLGHMAYCHCGGSVLSCGCGEQLAHRMCKVASDV